MPGRFTEAAGWFEMEPLVEACTHACAHYRTVIEPLHGAGGRLDLGGIPMWISQAPLGMILHRPHCRRQPHLKRARTQNLHARACLVVVVTLGYLDTEMSTQVCTHTKSPTRNCSPREAPAWPFHGLEVASAHPWIPPLRVLSCWLGGTEWGGR